MPPSPSVIPVLMCGGSGTRLWPISRNAVPKQFVPLTGPRSLLRETCVRIGGQVSEEWIAVTNVDHRFLVAEQLRAEGIERAALLLEPVARNTAPAIAVAAMQALAGGDAEGDEGSAAEDPVLVVLPSDHVMADTAAFQSALGRAVEAAEGGALATFGVVPTGPSTGYGYIRAGSGDGSAARPVLEFVEKPDPETAAAYVASGDYYWNSGMFVFRASRYLEELARYRPEMLDRCREAFLGRRVGADFVRLAPGPFAAIQGESVDYAVMEHTDQAVMIPLDAGWSDLGSWDAMWSLADKNPDGNVLAGDVVTEDTRGSYLRSEGRRLLAAVGLEDMVVVDTPDAVLVAPRARAQDVKAIVERLRDQGREEVELPARFLSPWGDYESLDVGPMYQVKRITVKPGAKLSLQKHRHRAEHWTVVNGTARVRRDDETFDLAENESCFLPQGCVHRLENPGSELLVLIEVQYGDYLGEDDIVRLEDDYGRVEE